MLVLGYGIPNSVFFIGPSSYVAVALYEILPLWLIVALSVYADTVVLLNISVPFLYNTYLLTEPASFCLKFGVIVTDVALLCSSVPVLRLIDKVGFIYVGGVSTMSNIVEISLVFFSNCSLCSISVLLMKCKASSTLFKRPSVIKSPSYQIVLLYTPSVKTSPICSLFLPVRA